MEKRILFAVTTGVVLVSSLNLANAYDRNDYPHWIDVDGDGQNTREEVLIRDSQIPVTFDSEGKVDAGLWVCPYTGRVSTNPSKLDVDHLVALGESTSARSSRKHHRVCDFLVCFGCTGAMAGALIKDIQVTVLHGSFPSRRS